MHWKYFTGIFTLIFFEIKVEISLEIYIYINDNLNFYVLIRATCPRERSRSSTIG